MTEGRFKEVSGRAFVIWQAFVESKTKDQLEAHFDIDSRSHLSPFGKGFYEFCSRYCLGVDKPMFQFGSLGPGLPGAVGTWDGRAASWLFHMGNNIPAIIIDILYVRSVSHASQRRKILETLVLHEAGHLVMHWNDLIAEKKRVLGPSTIEQEEEAWLFCRIIQGLAHAWVAQNYRLAKPPKHDNTWLH